MSALSDAMQEAYAAGDDASVDLVVFQLDHSTFPAPILTVSGTDDDLALPVTDGGSAVLHTAVAFQYTPPGYDNDGPTDGKLSIDNVSGYLNDYLSLATGSTDALSVIIRRFRVKRGADYVTPTNIDEELTGLIIRSVTLTATTAEGTLSYPDVREENFPKAVYTPDDYPGLVGL